MGDYNSICDICGGKFKDSQMQMIRASFHQDKPCWKVCRTCYQECNPQELVKGKSDRQTVPIPRPDSEPTFITGNLTWEDF